MLTPNVWGGEQAQARTRGRPSGRFTYFTMCLLTYLARHLLYLLSHSVASECVYAHASVCYLPQNSPTVRALVDEHERYAACAHHLASEGMPERGREEGGR